MSLRIVPPAKAHRKSWVERNVIETDHDGKYTDSTYEEWTSDPIGVTVAWTLIGFGMIVFWGFIYDKLSRLL